MKRDDSANARIDQQLVDYAVRNIVTGDEEDLRVLELTADELAGLPELVRDEITELVRACGWPDDYDYAKWRVNQDRVLSLLLPYISYSGIYRDDYAAWEEWVLADDEDKPKLAARFERALDYYPPEELSYQVRGMLNEAIDSAIENWQEGYWAEFSLGTTRAEVWAALAGFITSYVELEPEELDVPFMGSYIPEAGL